MTAPKRCFITSALAAVAQNIKRLVRFLSRPITPTVDAVIGAFGATDRVRPHGIKAAAPVPRIDPFNGCLKSHNSL